MEAHFGAPLSSARRGEDGLYSIELMGLLPTGDLARRAALSAASPASYEAALRDLASRRADLLEVPLDEDTGLFVRLRHQRTNSDGIFIPRDAPLASAGCDRLDRTKTPLNGVSVSSPSRGSRSFSLGRDRHRMDRRRRRTRCFDSARFRTRVRRHERRRRQSAIGCSVLAGTRGFLSRLGSRPPPAARGSSPLRRRVRLVPRSRRGQCADAGGAATAPPAAAW